MDLADDDPDISSDDADDGNDADSLPADPPEGQKGRQVKLMPGERVVFTEESGPANYLKLLASGEFDGTMLEALEDFVKRQRKRLGIDPRRADTAGAAVGDKPPGA